MLIVAYLAMTRAEWTNRNTRLGRRLGGPSPDRMNQGLPRASALKVLSPLAWTDAT